MKKLLVFVFIFLSSSAWPSGRIQNEDVKSCTDLLAVSALCSQEINSSKIWDDVNAQQLDATLGILSTVSILTGIGTNTFGSGIIGIYLSGSATLTLTSGTWSVFAYFDASGVSGGTNTNVQVNAGTGIYSADGANTGSQPTAISGSGFEFINWVHAGMALMGNGNGTAVGDARTFVGPYVITVSGSTAIYAVPEVSSTGTAGTVSTGIQAQRVL